MPKQDKQPPLGPPPNPLAVWMKDRRVELKELGARVSLTYQYVSDLRRNVRWPSDNLKMRIEAATLAMDRERQHSRPRGVKATDWLTYRAALDQYAATMEARP